MARERIARHVIVSGCAFAALLSIIALLSVGCSDSVGPDDSEVITPPAGMVFVPAGIFTMGDGIAMYGIDEHEVTLSNAFYLGQHEITNQEYMEMVQWAYDQGYVTATPAEVQDNLDGSTAMLLDMDDADCEIQFNRAGTFYLRESPSSHAQTAYPGGYDPSQHPVMEVTWFGSVRYCDWLSLEAGIPRAYEHGGDWACNGGDPYGAAGYRLPTDAEWEYAAQFNDDRAYPWGNDAPSSALANYLGCVGWTTPVGSYPDAPADPGLADMAGNLWEWCNDWGVHDLGTAAVTDPSGAVTGTYRVVRGGTWCRDETDLRCARRGDPNPGSSDLMFGFRTAKTVAP